MATRAHQGRIPARLKSWFDAEWLLIGLILAVLTVLSVDLGGLSANPRDDRTSLATGQPPLARVVTSPDPSPAIQQRDGFTETKTTSTRGPVAKAQPTDVPDLGHQALRPRPAGSDGPHLAAIRSRPDVRGPPSAA